MARLDRYVTAPDGMQWIVGRRFLFGPPRYIGFRFGRPKREFEPIRVKRVPHTGHQPQSPTATVRGGRAGRPWPDEPAGPASSGSSGSWNDSGSRGSGRTRRRGYRQSGGTIFVPVRSGSWGGGSSGGFSGGGGGVASSSGSRVASSSGSRLSSSGGSRGSDGGGKGGAGGAIAGVGAALVKFLKIALIVIAIAVATWLTIFVLIPALIFGVWSLLVGLSMLWHLLSRRPWIVEATEARDAPNVRAWAVVGWRQSAAVITEVADAIAEGREPRPVDATEVAVD